MAVSMNEEMPRMVRTVEVRVGDEWIRHNFGRDVDFEAVRFRLLQIVDALAPPPPEIDWVMMEAILGDRKHKEAGE